MANTRLKTIPVGPSPRITLRALKGEIHVKAGEARTLEIEVSDGTVDDITVDPRSATTILISQPRPPRARRQQGVPRGTINFGIAPSDPDGVNYGITGGQVVARNLAVGGGAVVGDGISITSGGKANDAGRRIDITVPSDAQVKVLDCPGFKSSTGVTTQIGSAGLRL